MEILISIFCAYFIAGFMSVSEQLSKDPLNKPAWAFNPTFGKVILMTLAWPISQVLYNEQGTGQLGRSIAYGLLAVIIQITWLSIYFWGVYTLLGFYIQNLFWHVSATILTSIICIFIVGPIATILSIPISLFFGFFIDLIFPLKKNESEKET